MTEQQLIDLIEAKLSAPKKSPALTSLLKAVAHSERVAEEAHPCKYGHLRCSDRDGGECADELWSQVA
jgi:hypothetical protein